MGSHKDGGPLVGIGLRFAVDIGAHREAFYKPEKPFENQVGTFAS